MLMFMQKHDLFAWPLSPCIAWIADVHIDLRRKAGPDGDVCSAEEDYVTEGTAWEALLSPAPMRR